MKMVVDGPGQTDSNPTDDSARPGPILTPAGTCHSELLASLSQVRVARARRAVAGGGDRLGAAKCQSPVGAAGLPVALGRIPSVRADDEVTRISRC